jgi:hypothetical protein
MVGDTSAALLLFARSGGRAAIAPFAGTQCPGSSFLYGHPADSTLLNPGALR